MACVLDGFVRRLFLCVLLDFAENKWRGLVVVVPDSPRLI
jgi:hypothetical protein